MSLGPDMDDLRVHSRIADGVRLDAQVQPRRRAAAQGMARDGKRHRLLGRARPFDRAIAELGDREPLPAVRRMPVLLQVLGLGHHHVDHAEIAGLERERRRVARRKHGARRCETTDPRVDAGQRALELRRGHHRRGARRRAALGRMALLQLLPGAEGELVQLQGRAPPRIAEDLGSPGERRLAVEGRSPDAPQARIARQVAGVAQAVLSPLLHGRLDEGEPSVAEALGERRPGFRQHMTDARGVALERQLLEPVELFPGQPQHRRLSAPAP